MKTKLLIPCLLFLLTACTTGPLISHLSNPASPRQFSEDALKFGMADYIIQPMDALDLRFLYNPELNEIALPVRPDGRIALQLIGEVTAAGLTPGQFSNLLKEKYSVELKKPEVTVQVRSFTGNRIYVDGEVRLPRLVEYRPGSNIMQVLAEAGGMVDSARRTQVIVIRKGFDDKPPQVTSVNVKQIIDGSDLSQNIYLKPFDIVYVPKSTIAQLDLWVAQYMNALIPGGFPAFSGFYNPYTFSFGGYAQATGR